LDKLLIRLGGSPRNDAAADDEDDEDLFAQKQRKTTGLSKLDSAGGKMDKPTTKFVRGASVAEYELDRRMKTMMLKRRRPDERRFEFG